jgi:hypothetical protein
MPTPVKLSTRPMHYWVDVILHDISKANASIG